MAISSIFPQAREVLANYNWVDVAAATGYISYDVYKTVDSTGITRMLMPTREITNLYSQTYFTPVNLAAHFLYRGTATTSTSYTKIFDLNFDLTEFQLPRTIKGLAHLKVGISAYAAGAAVQQSYVYIIAKIRKWDGATETEIASVQSLTLNKDDLEKEITYSLGITIPQTHFKKGEQLRLTIEGWGKTESGTDSLNIAVGGDPQDRGDSDGAHLNLTAGNSRIILNIPFKIEV